MKWDEEIDLAVSKYEQVNRLHDDADRILTLIVDEAITNGREAVEDLIIKLPTCFYRAELQVWLRQVK